MPVPLLLLLLLSRGGVQLDGASSDKTYAPRAPDTYETELVGVEEAGHSLALYIASYEPICSVSSQVYLQATSSRSRLSLGLRPALLSSTPPLCTPSGNPGSLRMYLYHTVQVLAAFLRWHRWPLPLMNLSLSLASSLVWPGPAAPVDAVAHDVFAIFRQNDTVAT